MACLPLWGDRTVGWKSKEWEEAQQQYDVLVGTAALLFEGIKGGYIPIGEYSLVVFDECHHAKGSSPMAGICRWLQRLSPLPSDRVSASAVRVLGLTASWEIGKISTESKLASKRKILETLMQAVIYIPPSLPDIDKMEKARFVDYKPNITPMHKQLVENIVRKGLFDPFDDLLDRQQSGKKLLQQQVNTWKRQWEYPLVQLGLLGCELFIEKDLVRALQKALTRIDESLPDESFQSTVVLPFTDELRKLRDHDTKGDKTHIVPHVSHKVEG